MTVLLYLVLAFLTAAVLIPLWTGLTEKYGHLQNNYCGRPVPQSAGMVFIPVYACAAAWGRLCRLLQPAEAAGVFIIAAGFGLLGLIDDFEYEEKAKGFSGHLRSLIEKGRITTGLLKAVFGFPLSLSAAYLLTGNIIPAFPQACITALSANFLNLLDLRPGRALKGFFLLAWAAILLQPRESVVLLLVPFLLCAMALFPRDLAGRAMLGDCGVNILGGVAGFLMACYAPPGPRLVYFLLLLIVHGLAEKISFSRLIENSPPLLFLDRLGRGDLQERKGKERKGRPEKEVEIVQPPNR